jgi:hypothetical protein
LLAKVKRPLRVQPLSIVRIVSIVAVPCALTRASAAQTLRLRWEYRPGSELFVGTATAGTVTGGYPDLLNRSIVICDLRFVICD